MAAGRIVEFLDMARLNDVDPDNDRLGPEVVTVDSDHPLPCRYIAGP